MEDVLTQQVEKLTQKTKISYMIAGCSLAFAIVIGALWLMPDNTKHQEQKLDAISTEAVNDVITPQDEVSGLSLKEASYIKTIDSLKSILAALELPDGEEVGAVETAANAVETDYIGQMIENAKRFSSTDCSKSLAFLYAAKKVANMEKRTGANLETIQAMIAKCEENVFGASAVSSK
jgi:hypothetical protein